MGEIFVNMLPYAIGIAISPVPVITVILTLFSARARANGPSFLLGWAIGIAIPAAVILMLAIRTKGDEPLPPSYTASILRVALGLALLVFAIRQWSQRHKPSSKPLLMKVVDSITPWKALLVGFLFADVTNPKNIALTIGGCMEISTSRSFSEMAFMLSLFVMISSAGVALPVILYLLGGESSRNTMEGWKQWLVLHKKGVMAILFIIFGLSLIVKGTAGLFN
jgi:hypothetical protein